MNIFNIIGPEMIGPSSSHTAGAVRLGNVAYEMMLGAKPLRVKIELSGSFGTTYKGHGTDRALIAGILGFKSDDEAIRNSLKIAEEMGLNYSFVPTQIPDAHPNTARISFECENGLKGRVMGASVGGGNIRIHEINGLKLDIAADSPTLLIIHSDTPGVIADVTNHISDFDPDNNICNFTLSRDQRGGTALMTIALDNIPKEELGTSLENIENVQSVILIKPV
ncbi:MAG: L-serine ammonia-lyase, iron-sulfur-dependent, subunit beta [Clostridiales bacterium]|nr:L-serine ammonia-lyase, iron-sulfur-dependent, subunit beta [Clostridiales bacterium]